jgi:hypothetical protein
LIVALDGSVLVAASRKDRHFSGPAASIVDRLIMVNVSLQDQVGELIAARRLAAHRGG